MPDQVHARGMMLPCSTCPLCRYQTPLADTLHQARLIFADSSQLWPAGEPVSEGASWCAVTAPQRIMKIVPLKST